MRGWRAFSMDRIYTELHLLITQTCAPFSGRLLPLCDLYFSSKVNGVWFNWIALIFQALPELALKSSWKNKNGQAAATAAAAAVAARPERAKGIISSGKCTGSYWCNFLLHLLDEKCRAKNHHQGFKRANRRTRIRLFQWGPALVKATPQMEKLSSTVFKTSNDRTRKP